jgi:hypothetical protein
MKIPILAPRPHHPVAVHDSEPVSSHIESEWTAVYPEIERLYVLQRRKLRYVMQYMESEHGFKAT